MSGEARVPKGAGVDPLALSQGFLFWAETRIDTWEEAKAELSLAFEGSRASAQREESIVYIVSNDALLGRSGGPAAMVAAGLLSGARTAAVEGWKKDWTANVLAYEADQDPESVLQRAVKLLEDGMISGELVHLGPGHIGKALA
jgi:hypothetical protein